MSHDHQILADDDLALEQFRDRLAPCVVADAVNRGGKVREHKRFDARFLSDAADIFGRRVIGLRQCVPIVLCGRHHIGHVSTVQRPAMSAFDPKADIDTQHWTSVQLDLGIQKQTMKRRGGTLG